MEAGADFERTLTGNAPPAEWPSPLAALWWDAQGSWDRAHQLVAADEDSAAAAWVHAYLHRQEGDAANARYWYARAKRSVSSAPLAVERRTIAAALLFDLARR